MGKRLVLKVVKRPEPRERYLKERAEREEKTSKVLAWFGIGAPAPTKKPAP